VTKFPSAMLGVTRAAAFVLALAGPGLVGTAYADDEYGVATHQGGLIRQSAASAPSFSNFVALALGQKPAQTAAAKTAPTASDVSAGNKQDLLGTGGPQDALARLIHHPGAGTDW
jgi:hypothetical protein